MRAQEYIFFSYTHGVLPKTTKTESASEWASHRPGDFVP